MREAGGVIIDLVRVVMAKIIQPIQPEWTLPGGKHASISLYQHRNIISKSQLLTQKHFLSLNIHRLQSYLTVLVWLQQIC